MFKFISSILIGVVLWLAVPYAACAEVTFPTDKLSIVTASGKVDFTVEVATTEEQLEYGLMFRKTLAQDHGMLFIIEKPRRISMWMKNTFIPLDMLFIDTNGVVNQIVKNAVPMSENIISSSGSNITAILEINGGAADNYHIREGDHILYPLFR